MGECRRARVSKVMPWKHEGEQGEQGELGCERSDLGAGLQAL